MKEKQDTNTPGPEETEILKKKGFVLGHKFAEGAYACVYKVEHRSIEPDGTKKLKQLACKIIKLSAPPEFFSKFLPREMNILVKLSHPNIIKTHSVMKIVERPYIFMTLAEQGDLLSFIEKRGAVREFQAQKWFLQILDAVDYIHSLNITHRDLKCENILLSASFNAKLGDFGFAREFKPNENLISETFCGSIAYAPPEVVKGLKYNPKKADLWSLGVILFICVNKSMPFDDTSLRALYEAQMSRAWKFRSKVVDVLSDALKAFVWELLEPDPRLRRTSKTLHQLPWMKQLVIDSEAKAKEKSSKRLGSLEPDSLVPLKRYQNTNIRK